MYNSYTSLQREQLAKQTYTDTQSTYLLVYAPLRSRVLAQALQDQLHRKFRLVDHLAGELTDAVAGVLLVSEDVACLSTTLTYFAQALRDGADYAVCNAVFGFSGQTALYQSHGHLAENKFALVSRGLLARCRAADVTAILDAGFFAPGEARILRHDYGCDVLVPDRFAFAENFKDIALDKASIDTYMGLMLKGETR